MDNAKGREMCPKYFDKLGIPFKLTKAKDIDDCEKFEHYIREWKESCIEAIKELKPDLIVSDMLSSSIGAD